MRGTVRFSLSGAVPGAELHEGEDVGAFATDWHFHEGWQLVALLRGERHYQLRNGNIVARPGQLVVLPPKLVHRAHCVPGASFKIAMVPVPGINGGTPSVTTSEAAPRLVEAFISIYDRLADSQNASTRAALFAQLGEVLGPSVGRSALSVPPLPVLQMETYIHDRLNQSLSLESLSSVSGLSRYRLAHLFSEHIGLSPMAYHSRIRLLQARSLIAQGWSLGDISAHLNFSDQSHFGRQFKRVYAMTPGEYQQSVAPAV